MQLSHDVILIQKTNYPETKRYRYQHGFHRTRGQISAGKSLLVKVMIYLTFTNGSILFKITDSWSASKSKDIKRI